MRVDPKELANSPILAGLSADQLTRIAGEARTIAAPAGKMIFRENQTCEGFYIVAEGRVKVYKIAADGRERTLHIVRPPHAFAEAALFGRGSYPAFAAAIENSRVILVYREPFIRMLRAEPDTAVRVFESLSQWLHRLVGQLEIETFLNARSKLASFLLRAARRQGVADAGEHVSVALTEAKRDIAAVLGMAPETLSRALADLEARGLIRPEGRAIVVSDLGELESLLLGENPA
jgi:CRP-like cAMP-binding protein